MTKLKKDRHTQTKKAERQSIKHHKHNMALKAKVKKALKKFNSAVNAGNTGEVKKMLPGITGLLHKSVKKKIMKKNTASRKISQLARKVKAAKPS